MDVSASKVRETSDENHTSLVSTAYTMFIIESQIDVFKVTNGNNLGLFLYQIFLCIKCNQCFHTVWLFSGNFF